VRRVAAGVPLLEAVHERVEPDLSPRREGNVRVGRETIAALEAEHRRVRLPGFAFFVKTATTTSPTQREPTRSLAFLCVVPFSSLPCLWACLRAAERRCATATPMSGRRPAPSLWCRHTVATPGCHAVCPGEHTLVLRPMFVGPRITPRRDAVPCAERASCLGHLRAVMILYRWVPLCAVAVRTPAPKAESLLAHR
jgi:hypothetical protein